MDLNLVRLFTEIVEAQNLAVAARRQGLSRSAVSRGLAQLEQSLGTQLLRRTTRRLELTASGQVFHEHALAMMREAEAARLSVEGLGQALRGHVRVSVPTALGHRVLGPALLGFAQRHPQVSLRVAFSNRVFDLLEAQIDLAIRMVTTPPEDCVAQPLGRVPWKLCAAPAYLAARGSPQQPEDLARHDIIAPPPVAGRRMPLSLAPSGGAPRLVSLVPRIASEDFNFLLSAALAGAGVVALPRYAVAEALRAGTLAEVLPGQHLTGLPDRIFALSTPNPYRPAATRALIQWIAAALKDSATAEPEG